MLLDAFFRTLENEGLAVRVRDQMRVRVAFSARRDWSVPQVRGTLRVLLARDTDQLVAMVVAAEAAEAPATEAAAPLPLPH
jgi:hypothetical protein